MSLEKLLSAPAFIAFKDLDAPTGRDREKIEKDGHEMKSEPFYIVYTDVSAKDYEFKWPYNVIKIQVAPLHENDEALIPKTLHTSTVTSYLPKVARYAMPLTI